MGQLQGRVAYITGAASGIGRAGAEVFAREGASVAVVDVQEEAGREVARRIVEAGGSARFFKADVSDEAQVRASLEAAAEHFGGLHVLYNNAGGSTARDGSVDELPIDEWWRVHRVDLFGTFLCCRHALPLLKRAGGKSIINTTSIRALIATPGGDAYTAAKGAIISLTRSMALHCAPDGIRVNAISPGFVMSERIKPRLKEPRYQPLLIRHALGPAEPEDIGQVALFLASDASRCITGAVIPADCGASTL